MKMFPSEARFANYLDNQNKTWIFQPKRFKLKNTTYRTDFYCPDNDTFYEVVGTIDSFYENRQKYEDFKKQYPNIKFEIVSPNGKRFIKKLKKRPKRTKSIGIMIRIPIKFDDKMKEIANKECRTIASIVRQAIKEFLIRRQKR